MAALRALTSVNGALRHESFLARAATRLVNEVKGVNRVVTDVTRTTPGTIEWE